MKNELIQSENNPALSDEEIFTQIWFSPRKVFKFINDNQYEKFVHVLLLFAGISRAFDRATLKNMGDNLSLLLIIVLCITAGGLLGWISYYIYAALLSWTGKWLKGQGDTKSILRIMSYATIPSIIALIFLIPQLGIYGNEIFKSDGDIFSAGLGANIFVYSSMFLEFILGLWTIVLCVVGISEVQKISLGNAFLNLLLPVLIFIIPILLIALIFRFL